MTRRRLPIDSDRASSSRRGRGSGEPASQPVPPPCETLLLDSREVSRLLGIGRTKAFEMMARAEIPVVRIGRSVRVPRAALADWISIRTAPIDRAESLRR
jgi:excisionase family DNA binding protein